MPNLFAGRIGAQTMRANRFRLCFSSFASVPMRSLQELGDPGTEPSPAPCMTLRLKRLEVAARINITARRAGPSFSPSRPCARTVAAVPANLQGEPVWREPGQLDHLPTGLTEPRRDAGARPRFAIHVNGPLNGNKRSSRGPNPRRVQRRTTRRPVSRPNPRPAPTTRTRDPESVTDAGWRTPAPSCWPRRLRRQATGAQARGDGAFAGVPAMRMDREAVAGGRPRDGQRRPGSGIAELRSGADGRSAGTLTNVNFRD